MIAVVFYLLDIALQITQEVCGSASTQYVTAAVFPVEKAFPRFLDLDEKILSAELTPSVFKKKCSAVKGFFDVVEQSDRNGLLDFSVCFRGRIAYDRRVLFDADVSDFRFQGFVYAAPRQIEKLDEQSEFDSAFTFKSDEKGLDLVAC